MVRSEKMSERCMPIKIRFPAAEIDQDQFKVAGWVASQNNSAALRVTVNGVVMPHNLVDLPGLREALPQFAFTSGFNAPVNLASLPESDHVSIVVSYGSESRDWRFNITDSVRARREEQPRLAEAHRHFCLSRLICPACRAPAPALAAGQITCRSCQASFSQDTKAINMISGRLAELANIAETDMVSANPYSKDARAVIDRVTASGGMVLDCGAGSRPERLRNVINVEIVDYPSTDMLAVGEALPFADASFDAVLSLAVLEHVRDPFKCAQELVRVLKPGGEILANVPFLQPVHGYPHHYYNMTAQGLRQLFPADMAVVRSEVPLQGHPMIALRWMLREYVAGLPADVAKEFVAMRVKDIVDLDLAAIRTDPRATTLAPATQQTIACLNSLHLRKC
jgi:SAM-dependent methyltransferase